jgi:solute carrier family 25 protein 16
VPRSGLANFYRGFGPTILGMLPYAGVSFLTHDTVGDWLRSPAVAQYTTIPASESKPKKGSRHPQLTAAAELFSGAVAGVVSQTSSYPLEVIRRRMQVGGAVGDGQRHGIIETGRKIWLERGFRGFWVGLTIGYIKVVPMAATAFFVYERLKWSLGI